VEHRPPRPDAAPSPRSRLVQGGGRLDRRYTGVYPIGTAARGSFMHRQYLSLIKRLLGSRIGDT